MKTVFLSTLAALAFLSAASLRAAADPAADDLIAKGDVRDAKFQSNEALQCYLPAEKISPNNPALLTKISRQYRHLMTDDCPAAQKLRLGQTAIAYAKRAAAAGPNDADAQLSVAVSYGKTLPYLGTGDRIEACHMIKESADKTLRLAPNDDLAWHILGRWHRTLAEVSSLKRAVAQLAYGKLPSSTFEESARCFEKAIELNPNRLMHYVELGKVYSEMGQKDNARHFIDKGLAMKETEKDDPETKKEGRELLAKLGS